MKDPKHFLRIDDLPIDAYLHLFGVTSKLKKDHKPKNTDQTMGRVMAMIFEKPSLRTRVSFETGMTQLGGHAIYLGPSDIQMGKRETPSDVAKNLSRMVDIIMARVFEHQTVVELAQNSTVPVINALSNQEHPCQAIADVFTILEKKKQLKGLKIAFVGDGNNNVTHSLALLSTKMGMKFACASPKGFNMNKKIIGENVNVLQTVNPTEAVKNADVVVTDTWVSMGEEAEKEERLRIFKSYQVTRQLMKLAQKDAIFMHCLPAYRGLEVTSEVIDGPQSVVYDEAENRLHTQKALILHLLGK